MGMQEYNYTTIGVKCQVQQVDALHISNSNMDEKTMCEDGSYQTV